MGLGVCAGVEILENLAFLSNASNLVRYLSDYMHFSPSKSANNVTNFMGTAFLLALLGGFLSDAFFTPYHIYLISAVIEFLVITNFSSLPNLFDLLFLPLTFSMEPSPCLLVSCHSIIFKVESEPAANCPICSKSNNERAQYFSFFFFYLILNEILFLCFPLGGTETSDSK